jgi:replicative DNA helicase
MSALTLNIELPDDPEFEHEAIGFALQNPKGYALLSALEAGDFHNAINRAAWEVICGVSKKGGTPDVLTVVAELEANGAERTVTRPLIFAFSDGIQRLAEPANIVLRLKSLTMKRRALWALHGLSEELQNKSYSVVAEDQIGMAVASLTGLANNEKRFVTLAEVGDSYLRDERTPISSTGFPNLDKALAGGFHQNRMYGFSGKMKAGKTMFMCSVSYNMVTLGIPHVYLCLEMRPKEIGQRYYARRMGVNSLQFYDDYHRNSPAFIRKLAEAQRYFQDKDCLSFLPRPRMDLETLRATIATIALSGKYKGVFVDYAQLVGGQQRNQNEVNHLDNVCQTLAEMAATYPLWIVVGAQQNDDGGVRGGKGLAAACDVLFALDNSDPDDTPFVDSTGRRERRHLSMQFSRYTMATDIGCQDNPGYLLRSDTGPYFEELA